MKPSLLNHLVCPESGTSLSLEVEDEVNGEIRTGRLVSESGKVYLIDNFVPRFVPADEYADTFSRQRMYVRRHFDDYANDRSGDETFLPSTGFSFEEMQGHGLVLEAGCGYGRYLDVLSRRGVEVIGIDLSTHSIDLAQDFVGLRRNVHLVQCDLNELPFRQESFGHIYSIGVLHHTPSTRRAFESLVPYLRPGGRLAIWVYPLGSKTTTDRWRVITRRIPASALYGFCVANQTLTGWIRGLPGGWRLGYIIPGASPKPGRTFWQRVLSDFDNFSPVYAHSHSPEEVEGWFKKAGLQNVRRLSRASAVFGQAPEF